MATPDVTALDFNQDPYNLTTDPLGGSSRGNPFQAGSAGAGQVSDALQRLRGLQSALQSGQIDYGTYQTLFNQFDPQALQTIQQITGGGSANATAGNAAGAPEFAQLSNLGGSDLSTFESQFKNLTGAAPGAADLSGYFNNVGSILGSGPQTYADTNTAINQYIQNTDQPQIQQYQQQQQTNALNTAQQQAQQLIQQQNQQTTNQLTSPAEMQQIEAAYNQNGLLNSGAFSQGLGDTLANAASGNISSALGSITLPGISNIEGTQNAPYQNLLNNSNQNLQNYGQEQNQYNQFQLQSQLAQQLAQLGQPSELQKLAPLIQGAEQGAAQAGGAYAAKSAICQELVRRGIASQSEVDELHWKVLGSMFTRCRALLFYSRTGDKLVRAANALGFDWTAVKSWFIDEPLSRDSSIDAIEAYAWACKRLAALVAPRLWDEREIRPGAFDFFKFIVPVMKVPGYRRCYKDLFKRTAMELVEA